MAVIDAFHVGGIGAQFDNPNVPHEQFNVGPPTVDQGYFISGAAAAERISGQPVPLVTREITAFIVPGFYYDFYERIWLIPPVVDFGYVPSPTSREFTLWNAWRVPRELTAIAAADDEGLTLNADTPPVVMLPDALITWSIDAATEGPDTIDARYTFEFESGDEVRILIVVGQRAVGWTFAPNWLDPVLERPAWLTDVQVLEDGSEQRRRLRDGPRVDTEFTVDVADDRKRVLENVLAGVGSRVFTVPAWPDIRELAGPLAPGALEIALDPAGTDFRAAGLGMILDDDGRFEGFEVATVEADRLELVAPIAHAWPPGTRVYPARAAYLLDGRGNVRAHRNYARGTFRFRTIEEVVREALAEGTTYRGEPVLLEEPNWREGPEIDYTRHLEVVDFETGRPAVFDRADLALPVQRVSWTALDRAAADHLRAFLWARAGRWRGLWVPTWTDDLRVVDYDDGGSGTLDVAYAGVADFGGLAPHRRDLRIQLTDGTVFYRRVDQVLPLVEGVSERLDLDAALGSAVPPADFERVSWLMYMRLDQDTIELAWSTPSIVETVLSFKGPRNDV